MKTLLKTIDHTRMCCVLHLMIWVAEMQKASSFLRRGVGACLQPWAILDNQKASCKCPRDEGTLTASCINSYTIRTTSQHPCWHNILIAPFLWRREYHGIHKINIFVSVIDFDFDDTCPAFSGVQLEAVTLCRKARCQCPRAHNLRSLLCRALKILARLYYLSCFMVV